MTFEVNPNWSSEEILRQNEMFIKACQDKGFTFYDIGLDNTEPVTGNDVLDYGQYYLNEILEIFGGK